MAEAASELKASEAYVRRLLLRQRLYGIKVGTVWAIFPDDLEAFRRTRRPPGRPRNLMKEVAPDEALAVRIASERRHAGANRLLRKRKPQPDGGSRRTRPAHDRPRNTAGRIE